MGFRMIIAGGGTGGHYFPGQAVAQAVMERDPSANILFVGSNRGIEATLAPRNGYAFRGLTTSGFAGVSFIKRIKAVIAMVVSAFVCFRIQGSFRPSAVVGVGGYASFPMALVAILSGVPLVLLEQNVKPGLSNRLLAPFAALVVVAFPQAARYFGRKTMQLGNPTRSSLTGVGPEAPPTRPFHLLVFGGSRGARPLNDAVIAVLPLLKSFPGGIEILHQTGTEDLERVDRAYKQAGVEARLKAFLFKMEEAYAWCHAVLCRSGATTIAELAVTRRPAILVPFPLAAGNHQLANARGLEELGGGICIEERSLTPERLLTALNKLSDTKVRREMAKRLSKMARPEAAGRVAALLLSRGGAR